MRSRTVKLIVGTVAVLAFGAAAFFLIDSEKQIAQSRARLRAFDLHARETTDLLADLRVAQQAYVAAGQGLEFWMPKAETHRAAAAAKLASLRGSAASSAAKGALDEAAESMAEFTTVDARARDYLKSGQELMAADVVFTEGGETAAAAARHVEAARLGEHQALDASEAVIRRQEGLGLLGAGIVGALVILLLALTGPARPDAGQSTEDEGAMPGADPAWSLRSDGQAPQASSATRTAAPLLKAAAEVCTDFGRVHDVEELKALLGRAAEVMEASGLMVWLGSTSGGDLRPILAHGYSAQTIARMPSVPRSANNAAAAAYRSGGLQIVLSQPGSAAGAIVAPLLSADGCIGALSVETRGGGETSDAIQAVAVIFAAQLAGVLAASAAEAAPAGNEIRSSAGL